MSQEDLDYWMDAAEEKYFDNLFYYNPYRCQRYRWENDDDDQIYLFDRTLFCCAFCHQNFQEEEISHITLLFKSSKIVCKFCISQFFQEIGLIFESKSSQTHQTIRQGGINPINMAENGLESLDLASCHICGILYQQSDQRREQSVDYYQESKMHCPECEVKITQARYEELISQIAEKISSFSDSERILSELQRAFLPSTRYSSNLLWEVIEDCNYWAISRFARKYFLVVTKFPSWQLSVPSISTVLVNIQADIKYFLRIPRFYRILFHEQLLSTLCGMTPRNRRIQYCIEDLSSMFLVNKSAILL